MVFWWCPSLQLARLKWLDLGSWPVLILALNIVSLTWSEGHENKQVIRFPDTGLQFIREPVNKLEWTRTFDLPKISKGLLGGFSKSGSSGDAALSSGDEEYLFCLYFGHARSRQGPKWAGRGGDGGPVRDVHLDREERVNRPVVRESGLSSHIPYLFQPIAFPQYSVAPGWCATLFFRFGVLNRVMVRVNEVLVRRSEINIPFFPPFEYSTGPLFYFKLVFLQKCSPIVPLEKFVHVTAAWS